MTGEGARARVTGADVRAETLAALIEARADATPDAPMLFDEQDRRMSFGEYAAAVHDTAARLVGRGIGPGAVVAWQLPTRIETVVLTGALARLGAVQVPVLPIHRERELGFMLRQSSAGFLCEPGEWRGYDFDALAARVGAEVGGFVTVRCDPEPADAAGPGLPPAFPPALPPAPDDGAAVRWIFYSSGTTADPKGARITDRAAMAAGLGMATAQEWRSDDRYGVAFPFTHIGGLANLAAVLQRGYALILVEAFDPAGAVAVFARHGATVVGGGPAFYRAFLEQQRARPGRPVLPALRFMVGGGAPMPPAMHAEVRDEIGGRGCAHGYGMTETCSILAMNHPDDTDDHLAHTVGRVVAGMEARVVGPTGDPVAVGEPGELQVRGEFLMEGYVDAALDADAFTADGWFRTGDQGRIDADGYVQITGRTKDVIIRKGENISATEVEDLLYGHPAVAEVAVIGLPDETRGELVCAVVVVEPGRPRPTVADLSAHLGAAGCMRQKHPERVEVREGLPRNAAGKVQKPLLVAEYTASSP